MRGGHCHGRNNARDWHKSWVEYNRKKIPLEDAMLPEDDPRDAEPNYACPNCNTGSVTKDPLSEGWGCDTCDFFVSTPNL